MVYEKLEATRARHIAVLATLLEHNSVDMVRNMKTYLLFGIESTELDATRERLEQALGRKMSLHESDYACSDYYRHGDIGSEHFILQRNYNEFEGEWTEPSCRECGLLFYANESGRAESICSALAGIGRLIVRHEA